MERFQSRRRCLVVNLQQSKKLHNYLGGRAAVQHILSVVNNLTLRRLSEVSRPVSSCWIPMQGRRCCHHHLQRSGQGGACCNSFLSGWKPWHRMVLFWFNMVDMVTLQRVEWNFCKHTDSWTWLCWEPIICDFSLLWILLHGVSIELRGEKRDAKKLVFYLLFGHVAVSNVFSRSCSPESIDYP